MPLFVRRTSAHRHPLRRSHGKKDRAMRPFLLTLVRGLSQERVSYCTREVKRNRRTDRIAEDSKREICL